MSTALTRFFRYLIEYAGRICFVGDVLPRNMLLRKGWILMAEPLFRHLSIPISI